MTYLVKKQDIKIEKDIDRNVGKKAVEFLIAFFFS